MKSSDNKRNEELEHKIKILELELEKHKTINQEGALFNTSDAILIGDSKGYIIKFNNAALALTGYSKGELLGLNIEQLLSLDSVKEQPLRYDILDIGDSIITERHLIQKNGKNILVEMHSNALPDKKYITIIKDLSEIYKIKQQLIESNTRFKAIVENSFHGIVLISQSDEIVYCNDVLCKIIGYPKSEIIGTTYTKYITLADKDIIQNKYNDIEHRKLKPENFIFHAISRNGETLTFEASTSSYKEKDGGIYTIAQLSNITETIQQEKKILLSENKFKSIVEHSHNGVGLIDSKYTFVYVNPKLSEILDYSIDEIVGTNFKVFLTEESHTMVVDRYKRRLNNEKVPGKYELTIKRKDGEIRNIELISTVVYNLQGEKQILVQLNDITILKQSQERFKQLADLSFEGIIIHENGKAIDVNNAFERLSGYKREEILANNIIEMFVEESYRALAYNNMKNNYKKPYEVIGISKNGTRYNIEIESRNTKVGNRKLRVTAIRDITQRKKETDELKRITKEIISSEITFKAIFDNSFAAIYVQDMNGNFLDINKGAEEMYGYTKAEMIGKEPSFLGAEGKNDLEYINHLFEKAKEGNPQQFEFWGRRKDGSEFPKLVNISKGVYFGEEVIFAFSTDITKNKKREEMQNILFEISKASLKSNMEEFVKFIQIKLGQIIDTTNFYVAFYDNKNDTFRFPFYSDENDNFTTASAKKTLGKYVLETRKPLLADQKVKKELMKKGILKQQGTYSKVWMGAPLICEDEIIGVIAVQNYQSTKAYSKEDLQLFTFVSDHLGRLISRKKQEEVLKAALIKAEESDKLKSAFLANMSHEIRTPMNGILGFTSLLKDDLITEDERIEAYDIINKSGNRLLGIINDLIDISKIEAGQIKINLSRYNIYDQLKETYDFFKLEAHHKGLQFKLNVAEKLRAITINTDGDKLQAILTNLIKNAIKYTPQGEIEFGYELMSNHIKFYIKDTGIGIAPDRQKAIFERFVQADIEDRKAMEGAGLGLSITKAYVEMLGGDLWVKSIQDKGSTFYFSIPVTNDNRYFQQPKEEKDKDKYEMERDTINILIAEDDKVSFYYLKTILKFDNVKIFHAMNGLEVLSILESHPEITLILMDIKMPKMGGLEATKLIRQKNKDIVIIAQTANAFENDKTKTLEAGCDDYITKPIFKEDLYKIIESNINRKLG